MQNAQQFINQSKDILYLIGSVLGIIGFIRTLKKREYCSLSFKTDYGNEVEPYLLCLRGTIYNLSISDDKGSVIVNKYPSGSIPSFHSRSEIGKAVLEEASFFPVLKEFDFFVVQNKKLKTIKLEFIYEDKYRNVYKQQFWFDPDEIGNMDRIQRKNRSCYHITRRKYRFMYIWFPLWAKKL